ncbi:D-alanyl-D-alanine dipeptidase [Verrucosispora sp. SN26_14.1]|nr:D-alanyl-D-alanine dipeptidase [Verrucosispora sp. SN26_14.1]
MAARPAEPARSASTAHRATGPARCRLGRWAVVPTAVVGLVAGLGGCGRNAPTPEPSRTPPPASAPARPGLVVLSDLDGRILTDIRYATAHNFVGRPVDGYQEPLCLLTAAAARALRRVQDAALATGHRLKVYDCYRPQRAVDDFVAWGADPGRQETKAEFYPRVAKSALFDRGYLGAPTSHSRGSTVDLTLVEEPRPERSGPAPGRPPAACTDPYGRRFTDGSVDMGTGFDCFDPLSHTDSTAVGATAQANRRLLRDLMTDGGFVGYDREWWHFRYRDEPWPDTYFDLPVTRSSAD